MPGRLRGRLRHFWLRSRLFLAILGPGIITANVDNDAGGITTYSQAGARYGLATLWIFMPLCLALIMVQEMSNRMGVVSGKGLSDLIRERFGVQVDLLPDGPLARDELRQHPGRVRRRRRRGRDLRDPTLS